MPKYQVSDPQTGAKYEIESDTPPTAEDIAQIFGQNDPVTFGDRVVSAGKGAVGAAETLLSFGSAAVAEPIAGIAGLAALPFQGEDAANTVNAVRDFIRIDPVTETGQNIVQGVGVVANEAVEAARTPVAGLAGLASALPAVSAGGFLPGQNPADDLSRAAATVNAVQERGLGVAAGDAVAERVGPVAGAVTQAVPEALLSLVPLRQARLASTPAPQGAPQAGINVTTQQGPGSIVGVRDALRRENVETTAELADPDPEILAAAEELGIDLNPDHASRNRAFVDATQALKSRPNSQLATREQAAIEALGARADELVNNLASSSDRSLLDANVRSGMRATIKDLEGQSDAAYDVVNRAIPRNTRITGDSVREYLDNQIDDLGGESLLNAAEKRVLKLFGDEQPTYGALDRVRKNIGAALGGKDSPFRDVERGELSQLYRALSEDQQRIANDFGVGAEYELGRGLVSKRIQVQDAAIDLFGRQMQGSLVPKLRGSANALTRGDTSQFKKLMEALPEGSRQEAATLVMNELFTLGSRSGQTINQSFASTVQRLNNSPEAKKVLFDALPDYALERFDAIATVSTGIFRARALQNNSRTARDVIAALDDASLFSKLMGSGSRALAAEGVSTPAGVPGAGAAGVIAASIVRRPTPRTEAAEAFLLSPRFREGLEAYAEGRPDVGNQIAAGGPAYRRWLETVDENSAREIAETGLISWLVSNDE